AFPRGRWPAGWRCPPWCWPCSPPPCSGSPWPSPGSWRWWRCGWPASPRPYWSG
ncbi:unnamed protein product, partial [Heterosigma akashiwo]